MKVYTGRTKIEINYKSSDINKKNIGTIIQDIMPTVVHNSAEYTELYKIYRGYHHIISTKKRSSETNDNQNSEVRNNIIVENHPFKFVNFKSSYLIADGFKYSQVTDKSTDDVTILNRYFVEQNKKALDTERAEDMYIGGTAYLFIKPKENVSKIKNFDYESPFELFNLENDKTFVAYSTIIGEDVALSGYFCEIENKKYQYTIYTNEKIFTFTSDEKYSVDTKSIKETENVLGRNPIIEYPLNKSRIGTVEIVSSIFNAIDIITSNEVDNIVDFVNSLLVFYNSEIDENKIAKLRELGIMALFDKNPQMPAKAEYIAKQLQHADVGQVYDRLIKAAHAITGVPISSGQVTSGGDTGVARQLGNGYENADLIIALEETAFLKSERKALELELSICKAIKECKIDELYSADIEINATRHNLDNMLVKVQSLAMLNDIGFPEEAALAYTKVGSNPHELAQLWKNNKEAKEEEQQDWRERFNTEETDETEETDDITTE